MVQDERQKCKELRKALGMAEGYTTNFTLPVHLLLLCVHIALPPVDIGSFIYLYIYMYWTPFQIPAPLLMLTSDLSYVSDHSCPSADL